MRSQFHLRMRRELGHPYRIEAVNIPCPMCGNGSNFSAIFRPFFISKIRVVQCGSCKARFQQPMPTERFLEWMYANKYMKSVAREQSAAKPTVTQDAYVKFRKRAEKIQQFVSSHAPKTDKPVILEVGSAHGCNLEIFRDMNGSSILFEDEIDRSWDAHYKTKKITNWNQRQPNTNANVIILSHVLEHFRDPVTELKRLRNMLDDDGVFYIEVPNIPENREYFSGFKLAHTFYFSEQSLVDATRRAGLQLVNLEKGRSIHSLWRKCDLELEKSLPD